MPGELIKNVSGVNYTKLASTNPVQKLSEAVLGIAGIQSRLVQDANENLVFVADTVEAITITAKVNEAAGVTKGQVVFISGATGGFPQVSLADNTIFSKADVLAVATETKADNQNIVVTSIGSVENIDTSAFLEGDILYLGTAGNITKVHPAGINAVQRVGHAVKINASTGSILVELDILTEIAEFDGLLRNQIVNTSTGVSSSVSTTWVNDAGHRAASTLLGSNNTTYGPGAEEAFVTYNEGYNDTINIIDGLHSYLWAINPLDSHVTADIEVMMTLSELGELITKQQCLKHTAIATDDHALEIACSADGFGDVKALDIDYITGAIATGSDDAVILVNVDESLANGGDIVGLEVIATEGGADNIFGMLVGAGIHPIEQLTGQFADFDTVLDEATDVTTELSTGGAGNIAIFTLDNETVTVGKSIKFEEIEIILGTNSSQNITPVFEYSTGIGTWGTFTPIDGTNGMRNTGVVVWLDGNIPSWATGTGGEYLIRITRTRNNITTTPIVNLIKGASITPYTWNKDGDIEINNAYLHGDLTVNPSVTATPVNIGELTFEATSDTSLTIKYKGSDGTVRSNVLTLS